MTNPVQSHELVEDVDYTGDGSDFQTVSPVAFYGMPGRPDGDAPPAGGEERQGATGDSW